MTIHFQQEALLRILDYDESGGLLFWRSRGPDLIPGLCARRSWNAKNAGKEALAHINQEGYKCGTLFGKGVLAHRIIWLRAHGICDGEIDHIDGDKTNNRLSNLRIVSAQENQRNKPMPVCNTSGIVGVGFHKRTGRWSARIGAGNNRIWLGLFQEFDAAVKARKDAEHQYGYHPNHGRAINTLRA